MTPELEQTIPVVETIVTTRNLSNAAKHKVEAIEGLLGMLDETEIDKFFLGAFHLAVSLGYKFPQYEDDPRRMLTAIEVEYPS